MRDRKLSMAKREKYSYEALHMFSCSWKKNSQSMFDGAEIGLIE